MPLTNDDIAELNQLAFRYAAAVDRCDTEGFTAVFSSGARLRSYHPETDQPFADMKGHEQLASVPDTMRGMYRSTTHMMTNHLVQGDGAHATGEVLCTARHLTSDRQDSLNVIIRYIDRYVRQDGRWLIDDREIHFLWSEKHGVSEKLMG